jgi:four helix bundle protein
MEDFKDLMVWAKAHQLALCVYQRTRTFPREELLGLTSQVRRASASIGANIAEGCGRRSDAEFKRFLQIARGSASELECHLHSREIYDFSKRMTSTIWKRRFWKCSECWLPWCSVFRVLF